MCCCFLCRVTAGIVIIRIALGAFRLFLFVALAAVAAAPLVAVARLAREAFGLAHPALTAAGVLGAVLAVCAIARRRSAG